MKGDNKIIKGLPITSLVEKVVPKNSFDAYTTASQKKFIADTIQKITWTNKISSETTNLKYSSIREIQVFHIQLKVWKNVNKILDIIDKAIPYPIIFMVKGADYYQLSTAVKHPHPTKENNCVLEHRFSSDAYSSEEEDFKLNIVLSESIDLVFGQVCQILSKTGLPKDQDKIDFLEREKRYKSLETEIRQLESKIKSTRQFNKKIELNNKLQILKEEIASITDKLISKSDFKVFQLCPETFWIYKNDRSKLPQREVSDFERALSEQGDRVEHYARLLFPEGTLISSYGTEGMQETNRLLEHKGIIFQAGFSHDNLHTRCDVIRWNAEFEGWDIFEIKASTRKESTKEDHYWDLAFQREVLRKGGHKVCKLYLAELSKEYRRDGKIDISKLFVESDITEEIDAMKYEVKEAIGNAKKELRKTIPPTTCGCAFKSKAKHCMGFDYFHSGLPVYSIYDIARVSSSKLEAFKADEILSVSEIPEEFDLTDIQYNQVLVNNNDFEILDKAAISNELAKLEYPLYFLDYETYPGAIPAFQGGYPYQQVPFQYSLHIQDTPESELVHKEYLHLDDTNPLSELPQILCEDIGEQGSILVWNKGFESKVNKDLANLNPQLSSALLNMNDRMYDLEEIFRKQFVVMKQFKGRTSIKKVLPALVPDFSYSSLEIKEGGAASDSWAKIYFGDFESREIQEISNNLLEYCKLDTLAMFKILEWLKAEVA